MLTQTDNPLIVLDSFGLEKAAVFTLRRMLAHQDEHHPPAIPLVDDITNPSVLLAHRGGHFMMAGRGDSVWHAPMEDLFHERIEQYPAWPDEMLVKDWEEGKSQGHKKRGIFFDQAPLAAWKAAVAAGFEPNPEDNYEPTANVFYIEGEPRFEHRIDSNHKCRLGVGYELVDCLRRGIEYDKEGEYVRRCVDNGPSFVCEVDGEKVCWSCTHLSGSLGMIYTPAEHRKKGYARSLAAFQIDYMLARDGFALCHVIETNIASRTMLKGFGFKMVGTQLVWRAVMWGECVYANDKNPRVLT